MTITKRMMIFAKAIKDKLLPNSLVNELLNNVTLSPYGIKVLP